uniref:Uncharacterized protein n=1 Tax=Arundo donax TaxID=35708 RepID=A0A0A9BI13_ARUDO
MKCAKCESVNIANLKLALL